MTDTTTPMTLDELQSELSPTFSRWHDAITAAIAREAALVAENKRVKGLLGQGCGHCAHGPHFEVCSQEEQPDLHVWCDKFTAALAPATPPPVADGDETIQWVRCEYAEAEQHRDRVLTGSIGLEGVWSDWYNGVPVKRLMNRQYEYRKQVAPVAAGPIMVWWCSDCGCKRPLPFVAASPFCCGRPMRQSIPPPGAAAEDGEVGA